MASLFHNLKRPGSDFDRALSREMLNNEISRVTLIAVMLVGIFCMFLVVRFIEGEQMLREGASLENLDFALAIVPLAMLYEIVILILFHHLRRIEREPPAFGRYANAFLETGLPGVFIYIFASVLSPAESLFSPPSYAYFLFILLSTLRLDFRLSAFTGFVAAAQYAALLYLFRHDLGVFPGVSLFHLIPVHAAKIIFFLAGGLIAGFVARRIRSSFERSLRSVEERNHIREVFGKHVSPEVVDKLLSQQSEGDSETRHVCVMFLDIRDFTTFSEKRSPEEVVTYLNTIFDFMIDIINEHGGIVNKFLGDGFMAVFGAPLSNGVDSQNAILAASAIIAEVNRRSSAGEIPHTRIGIGLHSGDAVTGNVGSRTRREYTIIGDTVNVASRIESLNKQFASQLLISESVRIAIENGGHTLPDHQVMEPIQVKGRADAVRVFKLA